jgi:hypothetical protein
MRNLTQDSRWSTEIWIETSQIRETLPLERTGSIFRINAYLTELQVAQVTYQGTTERQTCPSLEGPELYYYRVRHAYEE